MRFKMSVSYRKKTINEIAKAPTAPVLPAAPVNVDFYGEDVFNIVFLNVELLLCAFE